jgi:2-hydroxy-3-oxopropionate reductase
VFENAKPGTLLIDFSTIRPDIALEMAAKAESLGFSMLDAPVSGGEPGAVAASLSIMVGGKPEVFAQAKPLFDLVGKTIVLVGGFGAGQTVKAANQLMVAVNIQALSEAIAFLQAYQVDLGPAIEVLGGGLAGSAVLNQKARKIIEGDFAPGFRIDLHHKDMGIIQAAAREAGVITPAAALVTQLMASARANGDGKLDHCALFRGVQRLAGLPQ